MKSVINRIFSLAIGYAACGCLFGFMDWFLGGSRTPHLQTGIWIWSYYTMIEKWFNDVVLDTYRSSNSVPFEYFFSTVFLLVFVALPFIFSILFLYVIKNRKLITPKQLRRNYKKERNFKNRMDDFIKIKIP